MADRQFRFPVLTVDQVTDGDTYWFTVDLGFRARMKIEVRLDGWDTPEKRSQPGRVVGPRERAAAKAAQEFSAQWLEHHVHLGSVWVETEIDPEKYGRWLGKVTAEEDDASLSLGDGLAAADLATVWPTRWWQTHPE